MKLNIFVLNVILINQISRSRAVMEREENNRPEKVQSGISWLKEFTAKKPGLKVHKTPLFNFPAGSNVEVKWSLNTPFDTYTEYKSKFQLALPIKFPVPEVFIETAERLKTEEDSEVNQEEKQARQILDFHKQHDPDLFNIRSYGQEESLYDVVMSILEKMNESSGRCLLRTCCDYAEAPLTKEIILDVLKSNLKCMLNA